MPRTMRFDEDDKTDLHNNLKMGATTMKFIDVMAIVLVIAGALNWGLVGLFQFDSVAALLGDATALSRLVYIVVGAAGLFQALQWRAIHDRWVDHRRPATA